MLRVIFGVRIFNATHFRKITSIIQSYPIIVTFHKFLFAGYLQIGRIGFDRLEGNAQNHIFYAPFLRFISNIQAANSSRNLATVNGALIIFGISINVVNLMDTRAQINRFVTVDLKVHKLLQYTASISIDSALRSKKEPRGAAVNVVSVAVADKNCYINKIISVSHR